MQQGQRRRQGEAPHAVLHVLSALLNVRKSFAIVISSTGANIWAIYYLINDPFDLNAIGPGIYVKKQNTLTPISDSSVLCECSAALPAFSKRFFVLISGSHHRLFYLGGGPAEIRTRK